MPITLFPIPQSLPKGDRTALTDLLDQIERQLPDAQSSAGFLIAVEIHAKKAKLKSSLVFLLNKGLYAPSQGALTILMHRSQNGRLIRDIKTWLVAAKDGLSWRESVCDRIEDAAVNLAKKAGVKPRALTFLIEIGSITRVLSIDQGAAGAVIVRFCAK